MLSDSRTELPKDAKNPVPTGPETRAGGLDSCPAPPLGAGPKQQKGSEAETCSMTGQDV